LEGEVAKTVEAIPGFGDLTRIGPSGRISRDTVALTLLESGASGHWIFEMKEKQRSARRNCVDGLRSRHYHWRYPRPDRPCPKHQRPGKRLLWCRKVPPNFLRWLHGPREPCASF
jgi:hypothetical protein